jgi:hypothetical protein
MGGTCLGSAAAIGGNLGVDLGKRGIESGKIGTGRPATALGLASASTVSDSCAPTWARDSLSTARRLDSSPDARSALASSSRARLTFLLGVADQLPRRRLSFTRATRQLRSAPGFLAWRSALGGLNGFGVELGQTVLLFEPLAAGVGASAEARIAVPAKNGAVTGDQPLAGLERTVQGLAVVGIGDQADLGETPGEFFGRPDMGRQRRDTFGQCRISPVPAIPAQWAGAAGSSGRSRSSPSAAPSAVS